jgi:MOSC domain-containing protein YiiM/GNAT superfamily N-acetyltransferase
VKSNNAPVGAGRLLQVNVSGGGVPKLPVDKALVSILGVEGDKQAERTVHGGPHRAVSLFAIEAIERMQSEGHPIEPGSAGENLTTTGIEWSLLPLGTRARIGDELEIELASAAMPCATQTRNFRDGRFSRMSIDLHPSDSRMYARVVREGVIRAGDAITLYAPAADSRAADELILKRLDRAESQSSLAAWRAAAGAGFDVRIVADGELMMAASPDIPGPAFNHAAGLARLPNLIPLATEFYDNHRCAGWLITDRAPWPAAERGLVVSVFAAEPDDVAAAPIPEGVRIRPLRPDEGGVVERLYQDAGSVGDRADDAPNPWPAVYSALADHPHRVVLIAEIDNRPVGLASLHTHNRSGWLRGAAVVPEARGRGIQSALIAERVRLAIERGCDLVGAWAEPAGTSARNLQRLGMREVGTREHYLYAPEGVVPPKVPH